MRIEINAGGMGKVSVLSFEEAVAESIAVTASVIDSFVDIENDTYTLNGGVGDCQDAVESISTRIQEESERLESELAFHREVEDFIALAIRIDTEVADEIREAKKEFYQIYPWSRPAVPEEKSLLDYIIDGLKNAGEFLGEIAVSVVDAIVSGISDFVEENKEFLAVLVKGIGIAISIVGIVFVAALSATGAPFLLVLGVAGAMAFLGQYAYGTSEQIAEHGGDFSSYDMQSVFDGACMKALEKMLETVIGAGVGKLIGFAGGQFMGKFGKTVLGEGITAITKINYASDQFLVRIGKSVITKTSDSLFSGILSRFTLGVVKDSLDGGEFNIENSWEYATDKNELRDDVVSGVLEGVGGEFYKNILIKEAKKADVSTPKDKSVFYSGITVIDGKIVFARDIALEYGKTNDAVPIDYTPGGKLFNDLELYETYDKEFADYIWGDILSENYSKQAFGTINIVADQVKIDSVFNTIETPNILQGIDDMRITEINFVLDKIFTFVDGK